MFHPLFKYLGFWVKMHFENRPFDAHFGEDAWSLPSGACFGVGPCCHQPPAAAGSPLVGGGELVP